MPDVLLNLLMALQWVAAHILQTVKRYPRQSMVAFLLVIVVVVPASRASGDNQPTLARDRVGAALPAWVHGANMDKRGWWLLNGERASSPWLTLLLRARAMGWHGELNSGIRTRSEQAHLYHLFIRGEGAPAFKPDGPSRHLERNVINNGAWYQAVDVTDPDGLIKAAGKLGVELHQPYYDTEPWHVEASKPFKASQLG